MKYEIIFNRARKVWTVWKVIGYNAETVKSFKTEQAAKNWIARQGH